LGSKGREESRTTPEVALHKVVKAAPDPSPTDAAPPPPTLAGPAEQSSALPADWVVFSLNAGRYALPLGSVERIVRAVAITPLPSGPPIVLGVIDVQGRVLPVFDIRRRLGLPARELGLADQILIARSAHRTVALVVDAAQSVLQCAPSETIRADRIVTGLEHIQGVIRLPDGLVLIHDLDLFLSAEESRALDEALSRDPLHAG
jgi:purine-binding chemotaxis protein CheW